MYTESQDPKPHNTIDISSKTDKFKDVNQILQGVEKTK
jgi:hypothetical protein